MPTLTLKILSFPLKKAECQRGRGNAPGNSSEAVDGNNLHKHFGGLEVGFREITHSQHTLRRNAVVNEQKRLSLSVSFENDNLAQALRMAKLSNSKRKIQSAERKMRADLLLRTGESI